MLSHNYSYDDILKNSLKAEIKAQTLRAYRWTFLVSGLEHPKFVEIVGALTSGGRAKLDAVEIGRASCRERV